MEFGFFDLIVLDYSIFQMRNWVVVTCCSLCVDCN